MNENEWTASIKELLQECNIGQNIFIETLRKVPYAKEILSYDLNFEANDNRSMVFETDLLIYEKTDVIKPRVIIESKIEKVTTHDAITYSNKAQSHKYVTPYIRYGIMLGNRGDYPLPGRLFRHGANFDFMISFKKYELSQEEKNAFIELIKKEIDYSKKVEEMIYESRKIDRKRYFILEKELRLEEINV